MEGLEGAGLKSRGWKFGRRRFKEPAGGGSGRRSVEEVVGGGGRRWFQGAIGWKVPKSEVENGLACVLARRQQKVDLSISSDTLKQHKKLYLYEACWYCDFVAGIESQSAL